MRTLSLNFRTALFAQESAIVPIFLLTITHPDLADPLRLTSDPTARISADPLRYGTISRGDTFIFVGMEVSLPDEQEKSPPASKLIVSNIDRSIVPLARSISSPASVQIEAVISTDLDTVEFDVPAMDMINVNYDVGQLTFDLAIDALANEPFPAGSFDPASFPAIFY